MKRILPIVFVLYFFLVINQFSVYAQLPDSINSDNNYSIELRSNSLNKYKKIYTTNDLEPSFFEDYYFVLIQFHEIPSKQTLTEMRNLGIEFISYIPNYTYYIAAPKTIGFPKLNSFGSRLITAFPAISKIAPSLLNQSTIPENSRSIANSIYIGVNYPDFLSANTLINDLKRRGYAIHKSKESNRIIELKIDFNQLKSLAETPYIRSIFPVTPPTEPLNYDNTTEYGSRNVHQIKGLKGKNICVGVGDDSQWDHLDGQNRVSNHNVFMSNHGEVVAGLIAGGGNLEEIYTGHAPEAQIVTLPSFVFLDTIGWLIDNYEIVLANHSYGNTGNSCAEFGTYTSRSQLTDQQLVDHKELMHVISCGNSGTYNCGSYSNGFHTILDAHQSSKNGLDVANLSSSTSLTNSSSKGPVVGGRLKPEICARGNTAVSTTTNNGYGLVGGTSSAAPVVTGIMALMYEQYKKQHNSNPQGGLMKAIICNTAKDLGNPGPDFSFGFGRVNAKIAIETIENENYFIDSINHSITNTHTITVGANIKEIKVMLYWNDIPSDINITNPGLVNNLDLSLTSVSADTILPWILDSSPANVDLPAVRGVDQLNNIEQITLENPTPGDYTIQVKGTFLPLGSQEYYITYQIIEDDITLIHPTDGKALVPGEEQVIHWNAASDNDYINLYYSVDEGANWLLIADSISGEMRKYTWLVPNIVSNMTLMKVTKNGIESISDLPFAIISTPTSIEANIGCNNDITVFWCPVDNAYSYEVMKLTTQDTFMTSIGVTLDTNLTFNIGPIENEAWVSVRAITSNGLEGRRAKAIPVFPNPEIEEVNFTYGINQLESQFFHISGTNFGSYSWDFGDGNISTFSDPTHYYTSDGTYNVCLTVFDGICSDSTICKPITISSSNSCRLQDSLQLVALLNSTGPLYATVNWGENIPLDQWTGVTMTADGCHIKELAVNSQFFLYTLPGLNLPELTRLDLSSNFMFGDLRPLKLPECQELLLHQNQFYGTIPDFSSMPNLTKLYLNYNRLEDTIPNFNNPNLDLLYLSNNLLTGNLPDFSNTAVSNVYLQNNNLSGHLPDYTNLNLNALHIYNNSFTYDGLEENFTIPNFVYSPQAKIPVREYGNDIYVEVGGTLLNNTYEWYNQNDQLVAVNTGNKLFSPSSSGTYYCKVTNVFLNLTLLSEDYYFSPRIELDVAVWLEGGFNYNLGIPFLNTSLNSLKLLPGYRSSFGPYSAPSTPPGQPYSHKNNSGHWNYEGDEGLPYFEYGPTVVDWVLVSILSDIEGTLVWQSAGLLHRNGRIEFLKLPLKKDIHDSEYYLLVEHRNHMGVLTPLPVPLLNNKLAYDFRDADSYTGTGIIIISEGQKELVPGIWGLYAGEGNQNDPYSYDINGYDILTWFWGNGTFRSYHSADYNLDGDVSGSDKTIWSKNNGIFSSVPKY